MLNKPIIDLVGPIWCEISVDDTADQNSLTQWEDITKKLKPYIKEVTIYERGKINPEQLLDILEIFEKQKIVFHLKTTVAWDKPIEIFEKLKQFGHLLFLEIPLNGISEKTHQLYSENKNLSVVLENIRLAIIGGFFVNILTLITPENYDELEKIVEKMNDMGVRKVLFKRSLNNGRGERDAIIKLEELQSEGWPVQFTNCYPACAWPNIDKICDAGISRACVNSSGNVFGCENSKISFGNLLKNDISKIWNSKIAKNWRNSLNKTCIKCKFLPDCFGGCKYLLCEKKVPADPLMSAAGEIKSLSDNLDENEPIKLEENLIPKSLFSTRKEKFGCILISKDKFIAIKRGGLSILDSINNKKTLKEIQKNHGLAAIKFIYELYLKNFLEFELNENV